MDSHSLLLKHLMEAHQLAAGGGVQQYAGGGDVQPQQQDPGFWHTILGRGLSYIPGVAAIRAATGTGWGPYQGAANAIGGFVNDTYGKYTPQDVSQIPGYGGLQGELSGQLNGQPSQQEGTLANMLMQQAQGQGPSVAQQQLAQTTQGNIANAYALAQSRPNDAGAARNVANQVGNLNQQAAQQGALLRSQEQLGAMGQLGGLLSSERGQDAQIAQIQAQMAEAQQKANLEQQRLNTEAFYGGQKGMQQLVGGVAQGAAAGLSSLAVHHAEGGEIPGKAPVKGDSYSNDLVPAMLSAGEIVLPRSVTQDGDAPEKAKAFVEAIRRQHSLSRGKK